MTTLLRTPALDSTDLLAPPVAAALAALPPEASAQVQVAPIDADLADTAAFCEAYGVSPAASANCIVVAGKRAGTVTFAACVVLATTRADVNRTVKSLLDARRVSFAPMDEAVELTGMEFGGITPIGLPVDWPVFVDARVRDVPDATIGAGRRAAKLFLPGSVLCALPGVQVIEGLATEVTG